MAASSPRRSNSCPLANSFGGSCGFRLRFPRKRCVTVSSTSISGADAPTSPPTSVRYTLPMVQDERLIAPSVTPDDEGLEVTLRPQRLAEFPGQDRVKLNLGIAIEAARLRGEALDHQLLYGP